MRPGFTLLELLVIIGLVAVILAILLPVLSHARAASQSIRCLSNLRQIAQGFHLYADHNHGILPDPQEMQVSWESSLLPFVHASVFACPSDDELFPVVGSSYDLRDTNIPGTTLAGRPILASHRGSCVLVFESLPGWHQKNHINAAFLGDASAHDMDYETCMRDLDKPITAGEECASSSPKIILPSPARLRMACARKGMPLI